MLENGKPVLAIGSPGGSTIICTTLIVLLRVLDSKLSLHGMTPDNAALCKMLPIYLDSCLEIWTRLSLKGRFCR